MTLIAFLLSLSTHVTFTLLASLTSFLAAVLTLIAFAVDIALYAFVKHEVGKLSGVGSNTNTAPGESSLPRLPFPIPRRPCVCPPALALRPSVLLYVLPFHLSPPPEHSRR